MTTDVAAARVVEALTSLGIPHMLVGSYSRNYYAIPRSTKDVDIVIELPSQSLLAELASRIAPAFVMDEQITFETITGNVRYIIRCPGSAIVVELFILGNDEFQRHRFARRHAVRIPALNTTINLPTAEDVVIQKLRWGPPKTWMMCWTSSLFRRAKSTTPTSKIGAAASTSSTAFSPCVLTSPIFELTNNETPSPPAPSPQPFALGR